MLHRVVAVHTERELPSMCQRVAFASHVLGCHALVLCNEGKEHVHAYAKTSKVTHGDICMATRYSLRVHLH